MKKILLLTPVLLLFICQPAQAEKSKKKMEKKAEDQVSYLIKKHKKMKPHEITDYLKKAKVDRKLTFKEYYDFGIAWALQHEWDKAQAAFHDAVSSTSKPEEKAGALFAYSCLTHLFSGKTKDAGYYANKANHYVPENIDIAAIRNTIWKESGDALEAEIAMDRMKQIDMNMEGIEVLEPGTIILVSFAAVAIVSIVAKMLTGQCEDDIGKCLDKIIQVAGGVILGVTYFENGASQPLAGY